VCAERRKCAWDAEWDLKFNGWDLDRGLTLLIGISSFFCSFLFFSFKFYPWSWLMGGMGKVGWLWRDVRECID